MYRSGFFDLHRPLRHCPANGHRRGELTRLFLFVVLILLSGCASYASRVRHPRALFDEGQYDTAAVELKKLADAHDNDELLYLLDLGLAYHTGGHYEKAIETFRAAEKLASLKDYTSVSQEVGSLLLSDDVKSYKGEDFEKILINVYLAIDYTLLGNWDDALVECRRVDHKLDVLLAKSPIPHERNAFAKYLAGALFEARGEYNDALVDYRQLYDWIGAKFPYLGGPLLRVANRLGASEEVDEYRKKFPKTGSFKLKRNEGEIVVILEQGRAPLKRPSPNFRLIPVFRKRYYSSDYAWASDASQHDIRRSYPLFDIEATAIKELDDKLDWIVAKKVGGLAVKGAAGYGVAKATNSELLGVLTGLVLAESDHADLRSWTTLPARLQIIRYPVTAGKHSVKLDIVSQYGARTESVKDWENVEVKPGGITFLNYRTPD